MTISQPDDDDDENFQQVFKAKLGCQVKPIVPSGARLGSRQANANHHLLMMMMIMMMTRQTIIIIICSKWFFSHHLCMTEGSLMPKSFPRQHLEKLKSLKWEENVGLVHKWGGFIPGRRTLGSPANPYANSNLAASENPPEVTAQNLKS